MFLHPGDDPLLEVLEGRDINSVAGVLKLYFRELREPLFPLALFDEFIACSSKFISILWSTATVHLFIYITYPLQYL